jgi:hypothetical protein
METTEERKDFIINKVTCLASLEEGEEGKDEFAVHHFRDSFPTLQDEKFITCKSFQPAFPLSQAKVDSRESTLLPPCLLFLFASNL